MTERELRADLRALIRRWEGEVERMRFDGCSGEPETIEDCIADLKELIP